MGTIGALYSYNGGCGGGRLASLFCLQHEDVNISAECSSEAFCAIAKLLYFLLDFLAEFSVQKHKAEVLKQTQTQRKRKRKQEPLQEEKKKKQGRYDGHS